MFSRKKKDLLITPIEEEGRAFFRVEPSEKKPIDVSIESSAYQIKSLSDGGIGIYRSKGKELEVGEEYSFEMTLPLINEVISGMIRIIDISEKAYHCVFVDLGSEQADMIHTYFFRIQNEETRAFLRVEPSTKYSIDVSIGSNTYRVKDLGVVGIGARRGGDKALEIGKEYPFKLTLPLINEVISGMIRVVDLSKEIYHCEFIDLDKEQLNKMHLYVFQIQKKEAGAFFRVEPSRKDPVDLSIGSDTYRINNIGAGGIGLLRSGGKELEIGKEYLFQMTLPFINGVISGIIRVINISDMAYHCVFADITTEEKENIHLYVLERQKEALKEKKRR